MPSEIDLTLQPVMEALEELRVRFYICGSVASSAYGEMRATADIDLVAELHREHASALAAKLGTEYYADEDQMKQAIAKRSSFNLIHQETFLKVDIFAPKARAYDQQVLERRIVEKLGLAADALEAPICTPEDVVLAKLEWFRAGGETSDRQWRDILGVLKLQCFDLDFEYMEKWAREIKVDDLLEHALDNAGLKEQEK
jgi:hypothetical protein